MGVLEAGIDIEDPVGGRDRGIERTRVSLPREDGAQAIDGARLRPRPLRHQPLLEQRRVDHQTFEQVAGELFRGAFQGRVRRPRPIAVELQHVDP